MTRVRGRLTGDEGNAIVEFCFLGILLMLPLVYVVLAVFTVQDASYAMSSATREAGRAYVTSGPDDDAGARALAAARIAMGDHGLELPAGQLVIACDEADCRTPGARVSFSVRRRVALPFVPALFGRPPAAVRLDATHLEVVDRYRRSGP